MPELRVVIADDAIFMRTVLKNMLLEEDIHVIGEASNGLEAIEVVGRLKPDILTLDITMPELDGIEAISKIVEVSPDTKIIMVSAMGQQGMVIDAIKRGAKDFITKPFEKSRILQSIKKVMEM